MTDVLSALFGRLPIGWLQLTHNRARFAAALAGVAFANILVFMQLGFLGALMETTKLPYQGMNADILISASDANTISDGGNVARQRMLQALSVPGVEGATPLHVAKVDWEQPNGPSTTLFVFGIDPGATPFTDPVIRGAMSELQRLDAALIDIKTRSLDSDITAMLQQGETYEAEMNGRRLSLVGAFEMGAGFEADGYMIVSDATFMRLLPQRVAGAPSHIFVTVEDGASATAVAQRITTTIAADDVQIRPLTVAADADQRYQTTERPIGIVFGFGVVIGVLVGIIIVYQVLATDVADHLKEYATLKAIGYRQSYFLGIIFEEALVLAFLGFIPGVLVSLGLYQLAGMGTGLPIAMDGARPVLVLLGTLAMCMVSGAIATRRLAAAKPAELF